MQRQGKKVEDVIEKQCVVSDTRLRTGSPVPALSVCQLSLGKQLCYDVNPRIVVVESSAESGVSMWTQQQIYNGVL